MPVYGVPWSQVGAQLNPQVRHTPGMFNGPLELLKYSLIGIAIIIGFLWWRGSNTLGTQVVSGQTSVSVSAGTSGSAPAPTPIPFNVLRMRVGGPTPEGRRWPSDCKWTSDLPVIGPDPFVQSVRRVMSELYLNAYNRWEEVVRCLPKAQYNPEGTLQGAAADAGGNFRIDGTGSGGNGYEFFRSALIHEAGHSVGYASNRDISEEFANNYAKEVIAEIRRGNSRPPQNSPTPTRTSTNSLQTTLFVGNTNGIGVNLRVAPNSPEITRAWADGTGMTVIGEDRRVNDWTWKNVRDPAGNEGWVASQYLTSTRTVTTRSQPASAPTPVASPAPKVEPTPVPTPYIVETYSEKRGDGSIWEVQRMSNGTYRERRVGLTSTAPILPTCRGEMPADRMVADIRRISQFSNHAYGDGSLELYNRLMCPLTIGSQTERGRASQRLYATNTSEMARRLAADGYDGPWDVNAMVDAYNKRFD